MMKFKVLPSYNLIQKTILYSKQNNLYASNFLF